MKYDFWVEPTTACNLRCKMCELSHGYDIMPEALSSAILSAAKDRCDHMHLYLRGEPLLAKYEWFASYLAKNDDMMIKFKIITNGMLFDDHFAQLLSEYQVDLIFSVDSHDPEIFAAIRKGATLSRVQASIQMAKRAGMSPSLYCTVQRMNLISFPDILQFAKKNEITSVGLGYVVEPHHCRFAWTPFVVEQFRIFPEKAHDLGLEICGLPKYIPGYTFANGAYHRDIEEPDNLCEQCLRTICITSSGDVSVCCNMPPTIGNINVTSLVEILSSPEAHKLRQNISSLNPPAVCRICKWSGRGLKLLPGWSMCL